MFRKTSVFILILASASAFAMAQTPEANKELKKAAGTFAFLFEGEGGYLGVQTQDVTKDNFGKFGLSSVRGVAVEKIVDGSPAQAAGLQNGDVIVRFDGEEVASVRKLMRLISEVAADHQVKITVLRGNSEQEITATLGKRPMPKFENGSFAMTMPMDGLPEMPSMPSMPPMAEMRRIPGVDGQSFTMFAGNGRTIGIGVTALTKQLGSHYGVDGGLLINDVRDGSPAFKAGLKAGDIIVEADGKAVKRDFDLIKTIQEKKDGNVQVTFVRDGNRQTVSVTPEASKENGFVFETNVENGFTPLSSPGQIRATKPTTPFAPLTVPAPPTGIRPGRVL